MSVLTSDRAQTLISETGVMVYQYQQAQAEYQRMVAERARILAALRALIAEGAAEMDRDATEAAMRAVIAIHHGDADGAYALTRAAVRAVEASIAAYDVIYRQG